jgi:7-cyano-7-deazaguanine synthase in queuosine biosynthesis
MSNAPVTAAIFRCDGATLPSTLETDGQPISEIRTAASGGDINLRIDTLAAKMIGEVGPRAEDLVYIATYCVAVDQRVDRGTTAIDVHRERWRRRLTLVMPVSDPEFWSQSHITDALQQALNFATDDSWTILFTQRPSTTRQLRITAPIDAAIAHHPDTVVLFSGGIDSLCATVNALADHRRPIVVSHRVPNHIDKWQRDLLDQVRRLFPSWSLPHVSFNIHKQGGADSDPAQRTRAFLYAALGAAIAASYGVEQVILADNGYVSINPPISGELAGALASRGTHPTFLRLMNYLLSLTFEQRVVIENPLRHATRAEALAQLDRLGGASLLSDSHSCGRHRGPGRTNTVPHCGGCSQCVDRRTAVIATDLDAHDPAHRYGIDIFLQDLRDNDAQHVAVSYFLLAQSLQTMDADQLLAELPALHACLDPDSDDFPVDATELADVLIRHSREAIEVLREMYQRHAALLAANSLPAQSLLRLLSSPEPMVRIVSGRGEHPHAFNEAQTELREQPQLERSQAFWHVTYQSEKAILKDAKGVQYLARLLKAPGQSLSALDLVSGSVKTSRANTKLVEGGELLRSEQAQMEIIDSEAIHQYRERALAIQDQLQETDDAASREVLIAELEWITDELQRSQGRAGRLRTIPDEQERARSNVSKAISRVLNDLERDLPSLHAHLLETLSLGKVCTYDPRPRLTWKIAA